MRTRLELDDILSSIKGVKEAYFSPPEGLLMEYPCIVYNYVNQNPIYADNTSYINSRRYRLTVIDEDPDSEIAEEVLSLPYCSSERNFALNGMNHFVFILYF